MVQANGQLLDADGFRSLVVAYKDGAAIRLEDVAKVSDDVQNNKVSNRYYDTDIANQPAILLAIQPQPNAP